MFDLRPVGYVIGWLTTVLGGLMLIPLILDWANGSQNWRAFASAAALSTLTGLWTAMACANGRGQMLDLRQSFVLTTGVWVILPIFGALPFVFGATEASWTDALFEAMSGLTTTGATVFVGLEALPMGLNLWRVMLQWLGGLGIVIVALIFLPIMKIGGMQFFRTEGFDTLGKVLPRAFDISVALLQVYAAMTLAAALLFRGLGMGAFDAVIHALSAVSTGGFSNYDSSYAQFSVGLQYGAVLFMLLSTLPFIRFIQALRGDLVPLWRDVQVRAYLLWTLIAVLIITLWRAMTDHQPLIDGFHAAAFHVVSITSGTGLTGEDIQTWGTLPFVLLIIMGFVGGCTSSTGCSVKVFRYLVMFKAIATQIRRLVRPYAIEQVKLDGRKVDQDVIQSVILFFTLFIVTYGILAVLLSMTGLSPRSALTAAWSALADIGPVYGPEVSPSGAVREFPTSAKWLMIVGMMLGRLELLAVLVLFTRRFWAR